MDTQTIANPMRLRDLAESVVYAMNVYATRYNLNAIHFECDAEGLFAVATDGHRLALARMTGDGIQLPKGGFTIKGASLKALRKTLHKKRTDPGSGQFAITSKTVELACNGRPSASLPLSESEFPNWQQVMPKRGSASTVQIPVDTSGLIEALDALSRVGSIKITIEGDMIRLSTLKDIWNGEINGLVEFKAESKLAAPCDPFAVNGQYLTDALRNLRGVIQLQVPDKKWAPIRMDDACGSVAVIMPMRLPK